MRYVTLIGMISLAFLIMACGSSKKAQDMEGVTAEDLYAKGSSELTGGKYEEAVKTFNLLLDRFPATDLHIDVQLKLAEAQGKLDNFEEQMDILLRLLRENIIPERVPQIYNQLGKFYERAAQFNPGTVTNDTMDYKKAIEYYNKAYNYKDSDDQNAKAEALYRRAITEAKLGQVNKAIEDYRTVTVKFPDNTFGLLARIKLQNPEDTSELAVDEASLEGYRQQLGLVPAGEQESMESPAEEAAEPADTLDESFEPVPADTSNQE
ncbi:MAG TPA: tetratricopeptide repeat protein [Caldithrix abyssi]|uniref:Tetratricopeptide repeat protein n=1 Tax=Caldithrix abyssi TaxID=187145 RepID=A0A7V4TY99_CALAY|nr:tetratricopeptide repeat protein [Caldithrix abyssi]